MKSMDRMRNADATILAFLILVLFICVLGLAVKVNSKDIAKCRDANIKSGEQTQIQTQVRFGDYVRVKKGFYADFEGWADEEVSTGRFRIRLNDDTVPPAFIVREMKAHGHLLRNSMGLVIQDHLLERTEQPKKKLGIDALYEQIERSVAVLDLQPSGSFSITEPVEIDGKIYRAKVETESIK